MDTKGERVGSGMNWENGVDIYTLSCIKQTTNENLLYSTGDSTGCSGDLNGKKIQKPGDIHTRIADSLGYTAETNTALESN